MLTVLLTATTISTASPQLSAGTSDFRGRMIFLFVLVGVLNGPENSANTVLSWAVSHPTVVFRILLLTIYHYFTEMFNAPLTATAIMLGGALLARGEGGRSEAMPALGWVRLSGGMIALLVSILGS